MPRLRQQPTAESYVRASEQSWSDHRRLLKRARHRASPRRVHDLRVGTRRLLAQLKPLRITAANSKLTRCRRRLKRLLHATSEARDAHVQLRLFQRLMADDSTHSCRKFHRHLQKRDRRLRRNVARELRDSAKGMDRINPARLFDASTLDDRELRRASAASLRLALQRVLTRQRAAVNAGARKRHQLRIALKQFRYLVESSESPQGNRRPAAIARLHRALAVMGERRDLDLLEEDLERFSARHSATADWLESQRPRLNRRRQT